MSRSSTSKKSREPSDQEMAHMMEELRELVKANHAPLPDEPEFSTSNDTIQRFLKARKYVVKDAYKQLAEAIEWRRQYRPTQVDCRWCADQPGFHGIRQVGFDPDGRPVLYACFAQCQTLKNTAEDTIAHVVYLVENAMKCTEGKSDEWIIVIDCTGFSLPCCNPKLGRQFSNTFGNNYPEHLRRFYLVHHKPVLEGVWNAIKAFIDPVTAAKVKLVKKKKISSTFDEDFTPELSDWLREEMWLNRNNISETQRRFWEAPAKIGEHDPRGCPSYVKKYIEPLERMRRNNPGMQLKRSVLDRKTHLVHPNIIQKLNGLLNNVTLIELKQKKRKLTQREMEEYGIQASSVNIHASDSGSDSEDEPRKSHK